MAKKTFHLNGYNADIDVGTEDLHPSGGDMSFPAAAAATTVVSSDANDDGSPAGTGARTVRVIGLDSSYRLISEDATLNGTGAVTLTKEFYRVFSVEVLTAGSGLTNAGTIDVKHSATVLCRMAIGAGRSEHAAFTAPSIIDFPQCHVKHLYGSLLNAPTSGVLVFTLQTRKAGGVWQNREKFSAYATGSTAVALDVDVVLEAGEDVRLRGTATANNSEVAGGFQILVGGISDSMAHP